MPEDQKRVALCPDAVEIAKLKVQAIMLAQKELEAFISGYACAAGIGKEKLQLDVQTWELIFGGSALREVPNEGRTGTPEG